MTIFIKIVGMLTIALIYAIAPDWFQNTLFIVSAVLWFINV